jgi:hypothetical protein
MGHMPWTVAVVDLRSVSPPDQQDARAVFFSRRLASRQTVRAVVILSVHLYQRRTNAAMPRVHTAPCREHRLRLRWRAPFQYGRRLRVEQQNAMRVADKECPMPDPDSCPICRYAFPLSEGSE